jgi:hypothetical protein
LREYIAPSGRSSSVKALLLLLVTTTAVADPLQLTAAPPSSAYPELAANEAACNAPGDHPHLLRTRHARIAGHDVEILHDCGTSDAMGHLAIRTKDGWTVIDGGVIAYQAGNMTDAPEHASLVDESLSTGTFDDGPAIVYQSTTLHRGIERSGHIAWERRQTDVTICTAGDDVFCTRATYACPASGCVRPRFEHGLLTTVEQRDYRPAL